MGNRKISYSRLSITLIVIIAAIAGTDYLRRNFSSISDSDNSEPFSDSYSLIETTTAGSYDESNNEPEITAIDFSQYNTIDKSYDSIALGELAVVSKSHKSSFPDIESELVTFPYRTERTYRVTDYVDLKVYESVVEAVENMLGDFCAETGNHDVTITAGYRNEEKQSEALATGYSKDDTGASEHHTGYAVDFKVVTDDKKISVLENSGIFSWIYENSYKYGLVQRYTEDKAYLTDVLARSYHFRYVGIPHAYYMHENNLCLEEYIDLLENYEFDKKHLEINTDTYAYEVYYIRAETEGNTKVYVPKNSEYSISGNNIDGFIVTVLKGTASAEPVSSDNTAFTEAPSSEMPDIMTGTEVS